MIADTPEQIAYIRLCTLKGALKLEMTGLKRRGQSALSILKQEFGYKGSRANVLAQLESDIQKRLDTLPGKGE